MHKHVIGLDQDGLWKVSRHIVAMISVVEAYFLPSTKKLQNKFVAKDIASALLESYVILENFAKARQKCPGNVKTEMGSHLLENNLIVYMCVHEPPYFVIIVPLCHKK